MSEELKCYKCKWLAFRMSGYSDYTVEDEWIECVANRFKNIEKYHIEDTDKENRGIIAVASENCPFFVEGEPTENSVEDEKDYEEQVKQFKIFKGDK